MVDSHVFLIYRMDDPGKETVGSVCVSAAKVAGAERNIVLLGDDSQPFAVVELQVGFDRREI